MKRLSCTFLLAFGLCLLPNPSAFAQVGSCDKAAAEAILEVGNIRARIFNNGTLFWNGDDFLYEAPKDKGVSSMFASTFVVGGLIEDQLRMASSTYGPYEFWPGPLDANGNPPADCNLYDRIWEIHSKDFEQFESTGTFSGNMVSWPWQLGAPVIDGDGNPNNYNLEGGDRPQLLGDQLLWWVMNDRGNEHRWSDTDPIGLEVQASVFAFENAKIGGDITFYRYRLTNKNKAPLKDAYLGFWTDPDIGNASDDYVGSDSLLHLGYAYNGDSVDEEGYENTPPAVGHAFLITPEAQADALDNDYDGEIDEPGERTGMYSFSFFDRSGITTGNPDGGIELYNRLKGLWQDGEPITFGGEGRTYSSRPTRFMFPGDPVTGSFWSERQSLPNIDSQNPPSDRRYVASGGPFTLNPGESTELFVALVWAQGNNYLESVHKLKGIVAIMQTAPERYLASGFRSGEFEPSSPSPEFVLGFHPNYPNPFTNTTTFRYSLPKTMQVRLAVYDILGREVVMLAEGSQEAGIYAQEFDGSQLPPGIYFARIELDHLRFTRKLIRTPN